MEVRQRLVALGQGTYLDWYYWLPSQRSAAVNLTAGQPLLLEANSCNNAGRGFQQVAVRVTDDRVRPNTVERTIQLRVFGPSMPRSVALKWLYVPSPTVANSTAVQVTVSADSAARFNDALLALNLTLEWVNGTGVAGSGSAPPAGPVRQLNVTLPLAVPSAEMTARLGAALGPPFNRTTGGVGGAGLIGVRRVLSGAVLLLEIGASTAAMPHLAITAAALVALPSPPPTIVSNLSNCSFANPLMAPVPGSAAEAAYLAPPAPPATVVPTASLATVLPALNVSYGPAPPPPEPASNPSGTWALRLLSGTDTRNLPYDISAAALLSVINDLTSNGPECAVVRTTVREGQYLANVWNITW